MENKRVRIALRTTEILLLVSFAAISLFACSYNEKCPMHNINSTGTGNQKYTDGGAHRWAEYKCPGFLTEREHTFWVQCD